MTNDAFGKRALPPFLVLLVVVVTIAYNGLAAAGYINGTTPGEISDKYPTVFTPASYAFSIWSLIYAGLIAFAVYQLIPAHRQRFAAIRTLFLISCLLNCAWIFFWHHDMVVACVFIIGTLLATLIAILRRLRPEGLVEALVTKGVFGIYAGWITAATLSNTAIALKAVGLDAGVAGWNAIAILFFAVAAGAAVFVRLKLRNFLYPLAISWAATAIAVQQSGNTPVVVAAAICVIIGLVLSVSFVMDGPKGEA